MKQLKQLKDMNCVEALEALREGLQRICEDGRLPEVSLLELFINHAIKSHNEEVKNVSIHNEMNINKI